MEIFMMDLMGWPYDSFDCLLYFYVKTKKQTMVFTLGYQRLPDSNSLAVDQQIRQDFKSQCLWLEIHCFTFPPSLDLLDKPSFVMFKFFSMTSPCKR